MAIHDLSDRRHSHVFDTGNVAGESRTWIVVAITAVTMVAEVIGGWITGSMALLADGWHMGTHVAALAITAMAYRLARKWAGDSRFAFGTWKIEVLGAFSSALVLGVIAIAVAVESVARLLEPRPIDFGPALVVAIVGLVVNLISAWLLGGHPGGHDHDDHHHGHGHDHGHHSHDDKHADLNMRSAYAHVLTDALTSVLAIFALTVGYYGGWSWLDPAIGLLGAVIIGLWAKGLATESARVLLDREMDSPLVGEIRAKVESDGDSEIADLHVWRVGRSRYAAVLTVVAHEPLSPDGYRARLSDIRELAHVSIEVNRCPHEHCPE